MTKLSYSQIHARLACIGETSDDRGLKYCLQASISLEPPDSNSTLVVLTSVRLESGGSRLGKHYYSFGHSVRFEYICMRRAYSACLAA